MTRTEEVMEVAERLVRARRRVVRLERRMAELVGDGEAPPPTAKAERPAPAARTSAAVAPAESGITRNGPKPSPESGQVIALVKEGIAPKEIAERLKLPSKSVTNLIFRARKTGRLPPVKK